MVAPPLLTMLMNSLQQIYRTHVVWNDWRVVIFPSILYLATAGKIPRTIHNIQRQLTRDYYFEALGIATCYYSGKPNSDFFLGLAANIALAYSSTVIGLNFTCTVLICQEDGL